VEQGVMFYIKKNKQEKEDDKKECNDELEQFFLDHNKTCQQNCKKECDI
jgi:hypothetical protein